MLTPHEVSPHLRGTASLQPWHADYYLIQAPLSPAEVRAFVSRAASTHAGKLRWQYDPPRGRSGMRFYAWRSDYIGEGWPACSIANATVVASATDCNITVTVRVSDLLVVLWFVVVLAKFAFTYVAFPTDRTLVLTIVGVLVVLEYVALLQLRRRDPPQILAARLAQALQGTVTNIGKPPRELLRL